VSRESALLLNNVFLVGSTAAVFVGTLYPLALDALTHGQQKISVGPPYYALTFAPIFFAFCCWCVRPTIGLARGDLRPARVLWRQPWAWPWLPR